MEIYKNAPSNHVLRAFGLTSNVEPLPGGLHGAFLVGNIVLKEVSNPTYWSWICEYVLSRSIQGIRLQKPTRALNGAWSFENWTAYKYLPGTPLKSGFAKKLEICRLFHDGVKAIQYPSLFTEKRSDPWAVAERVSWNEESLPATLSSSVIGKIGKLTTNDQRVFTNQLVHCDLGGNILISPNELPAVIDLTFTARPVAFAEAVLIYDSIIWEGASVADIKAWLCNSGNISYLRRASVFRLLVTALLDETRQEKVFLREWDLVCSHFNGILFSGLER